MSKSIDELLEEIDDLRDQIHNLNIDLKASTEAKKAAEDRLSSMLSDDTERAEEIDILQSTIQTLEEEAVLQETRVTDIIENLTKEREEVNKKKENYKKALCMWEAVRAGNFNYFQSPEGKEFLRWAEHEFSTLWR